MGFPFFHGSTVRVDWYEATSLWSFGHDKLTSAASLPSRACGDEQQRTGHAEHRRRAVAAGSAGCVGGRRRRFASIADAVGVRVRLVGVGDVRAGVALAVAVSVRLIRIECRRAVVAGVPLAVAVGIGLIVVRGVWAVVAGIANPQFRPQASYRNGAANQRKPMGPGVHVGVPTKG